MRIESKPLILTIVCAAGFCGCPPESAEEAALPAVNIGDWVFEYQSLLGDQLDVPPAKVGAYLHGDGTVDESAAHNESFLGQRSWSQTGEIFRLRTDEFPYIIFEAIVERNYYLEGEYYDDTKPNSIIGTFTARWVPAPSEADPPDTQF